MPAEVIATDTDIEHLEYSSWQTMISKVKFSFRAVVCRVREIKSLSISDKSRAVNYSILYDITEQYNTIKSHYD